MGRNTDGVFGKGWTFRKTDPDKIQAAIDDLRAFQRTHSLGGLSVRDMIEEGRRY